MNVTRNINFQQTLSRGCLNFLPDYLRAAIRFFASSPLSESLEQANKPYTGPNEPDSWQEFKISLSFGLKLSCAALVDSRAFSSNLKRLESRRHFSLICPELMRVEKTSRATLILTTLDDFRSPLAHINIMLFKGAMSRYLRQFWLFSWLLHTN